MISRLTEDLLYILGKKTLNEGCARDEVEETAMLTEKFFFNNGGDGYVVSWKMETISNIIK